MIGESQPCDSIDVLCALSLARSLASSRCNFIFRVFYILTGTFFSSLSYNLITWCPASFRPSTHLAAWRLGHTQSLLVLNRLTLCSGPGREGRRAMAQAGFVYVFWISMILLSLILSHLSIVLLSIYGKILRRGAGECSFYFISFCSVLWAPVGGWWMDVGGKMVPRSDKSMLHASERKWLGTHRSQLLDRFGSAPLTNLM